MLKSRAVAKRTPKIQQTYPCLKKCIKVDTDTDTDDSIIVLFIQPYRGTVVNTTSKAYDMGYYYNNWDMYDFSPYYGTVSLISKPEEKCDD